MTSFGRQFGYNDVTYHIGHCNVDTRRVTSFLQLSYALNGFQLMMDSYRL